jgi:prepilin peptidase CpaA
MIGPVWIALAFGLAASIEDIGWRRISNWIPTAAFFVGVSSMIFERGWRGGLSSIAGAVAGFIMFFVFYWLGGMGGGDVKLMGGLGAVVGIERLLTAALWTSILGGLLAVAVMLLSGFRRRRHAHQGGEPAPAPQAIPYAPAIALGTLLALIPNSQ